MDKRKVIVVSEENFDKILRIKKVLEERMGVELSLYKVVNYIISGYELK